MGSRYGAGCMKDPLLYPVPAGGLTGAIVLLDRCGGGPNMGCVVEVTLNPGGNVEFTAGADLTPAPY